MMHVHETGTGKLFTGSGQVGVAGGVMLQRIITSASASGIIRVRDGIDATGTIIVDQFTLVAGTIYTMGLALSAGCYIELVSGTATFTPVYL